MGTIDQITVATYNILADAYIKPEFYTRCDPAVFVSANRHPRIVERVVGLDADVICLQEVDSAMFDLLNTKLMPLGYRGLWDQKGRGKPDGCATFIRRPWKFITAYSSAFRDGAGPRGRHSGHVWNHPLIKRDGRTVLIVNTHLKWDPPDTAKEDKIGLVQAEEILMNFGKASYPRIVCGDFNAEPNSDVLDVFRAAGFVDPHPRRAFTFNSGGPARKIDYILHSADLLATPLLSAVTLVNETVMPSEIEPSDHLPLRASFTFKR